MRRLVVRPNQSCHLQAFQSLSDHVELMRRIQLASWSWTWLLAFRLIRFESSLRSCDRFSHWCKDRCRDHSILHSREIGILSSWNVESHCWWYGLTFHFSDLELLYWPQSYLWVALSERESDESCLASGITGNAEADWVEPTAVSFDQTLDIDHLICSRTRSLLEWTWESSL